MKKLCFTLALFASTLIYAQDFQGTIEYDIEYQDLAEEVKAQESMLPSWMKIEVDGDKSRLTQPNPMGEPTIVLSDRKSGESIILMDVMGQKLALKHKKEDSEEEAEKAAENTEIEYVEGEEKEIAGYNCKKAIVKAADGSEAIIYYTEDLPNIDVSDQAEGIKGFPMEITMIADMLTSITRVHSVQEDKFEKIKMEIPEGYELKSQEEFKQMFGGMGM